MLIANGSVFFQSATVTYMDKLLSILSLLLHCNNTEYYTKEKKRILIGVCLLLISLLFDAK